MFFTVVFLCFTVSMVFCLAGAKIYVKLSAGRCRSNACLLGKTALVTGGNAGMGYQTAVALAGRGARVIIADRDNADRSREQIIEHTQNSNIVIKYVDYTKLSTVRQLAKDILDNEDRLDILVNNAGAAGLGNAATEDGLHIGMQVNHFAPFLLTNLLAGLLRRSAPSRIVFVSSELAFYNNLTEHNLNPITGASLGERSLKSEYYVYANSKLCNMIVSNELASRLKATEVTSNVVHPGVVNTNIFQRSRLQKYLYDFIQFYLNIVSKNAEEGSQTAIHVSVSHKARNVTGKYWKDCKIAQMPAKAEDSAFSMKIWELSEKLVQLSPQEKHC